MSLSQCETLLLRERGGKKPATKTDVQSLLLKWSNITSPSSQRLYLFYPLSLLLCGDGCCGGDAETLLEHSHAGLGLAPLDLGQTHSLLSLFVLQLLYQTLVVALHLLHLL